MCGRDSFGHCTSILASRQATRLNLQWSWREKSRISGWWFGVFFYFSIYWEFHHPNWLSYFSEGLKPPTSLVKRIGLGNFVRAARWWFRGFACEPFDQNLFTVLCTPQPRRMNPNSMASMDSLWICTCSSVKIQTTSLKLFHLLKLLYSH